MSSSYLNANLQRRGRESEEARDQTAATMRTSFSPAMEADPEQLRQHAEDLATALGAETGRCRDLAQAHEQLQSYAQDLNQTVSCLKAALAELQRAHDLNEAILRSTSDAILALDLDRRVIKANAPMQRILRLLGRDGAIEGQPVEDVLPQASRWLMPSLARAMTDPGGDRLVELRLRRRRRRVTVNCSATALRDASGEAAGHLVALEDVSLPQNLASMLYRYMSKPLADSLIERESHILGGARRRVTIMFADIRGFSAMSETAGAETTVALLNEYFSEVVKAVLLRGGMLDKYIGDAIMALFGVPVPNSNDPVRCVAAAAAMVRSLNALNHRRQMRGLAPIEIGVGIDTGDAVVGNIGCEQRMDFTAIGDTVNVASRLESVNKLYGTTILLSERTAPAVARRYKLREIDQVALSGKRDAVRIFEALVGWSEAERRALASYRDGLAAYRRGDWASGEEHFRAALEARANDGPSQTMLERCRRFRCKPPGPAWDGIWRMHTK